MVWSTKKVMKILSEKVTFDPHEVGEGAVRLSWRRVGQAWKAPNSKFLKQAVFSNSELGLAS